MSKIWKFAFFIPLICVLIAYLKPELVKQSSRALLDARNQLISFLQNSNILNFESESKNIPKQKGDKTTASSQTKRSFTLKANPKCVPNDELLFTSEELRAYDGSEGSAGLYLAYLGVVYDVSKGKKHYGPNGGYAFFAGKDATRAFITGEFDEKGLVDDVFGLGVDSFGAVREWAEFYEKDYIRVGRVEGTYYDKEGCPTKRIDYLNEMYQLYDKEQEAETELNKLYPPCNSEWSGETNITRVWCTKLSGGIERDWAGVPRMLFTPGSKTHRCACIQIDGPRIEYAENDSETSDSKDPRIREYPGCDPKSYECVLKE